MELSELQRRVDAWIKEYGVRYFSELTNMAVLTEEVGELARIMARKYGDQSFKEGADVSGQPDGRGPHGGHGSQLRQENLARQRAAPQQSETLTERIFTQAERQCGLKPPDRPAPLLLRNAPGTVQRIWCELSYMGQQLFVVGSPSGRNHSTMSMQIAPYFPRTP